MVRMGGVRCNLVSNFSLLISLGWLSILGKKKNLQKPTYKDLGIPYFRE